MMHDFETNATRKNCFMKSYRLFAPLRERLLNVTGRREAAIDLPRSDGRIRKQDGMQA